MVSNTNKQGFTRYLAGRIIRPFLYPVSGRILKIAGYPADMEEWTI
jgi:hypothetical protein